ncbi:hypothetical protein F5B17DRAFT_421742 [Nemania serpens]|nr:hypothetical protein F5B17DRAFT_421742 [Nemania serpens]
MPVVWSRQDSPGIARDSPSTLNGTPERALLGSLVLGEDSSTARNSSALQVLSATR